MQQTIGVSATFIFVTKYKHVHCLISPIYLYIFGTERMSSDNGSMDIVYIPEKCIDLNSSMVEKTGPQ